MLVRIHKLLQKPGAKLIVLFNSHLFIYYLFHTPLYHLFPLFLLKVKIFLALCLNAQSKYRDMGNSCFQELSKKLLQIRVLWKCCLLWIFYEAILTLLSLKWRVFVKFFIKKQYLHKRHNLCACIIMWHWAFSASGCYISGTWFDMWYMQILVKCKLYHKIYSILHQTR